MFTKLLLITMWLSLTVNSMAQSKKDLGLPTVCVDENDPLCTDFMDGEKETVVPVKKPVPRSRPAKPAPKVASKVGEQVFTRPITGNHSEVKNQAICEGKIKGGVCNIEMEDKDVDGRLFESLINVHRKKGRIENECMTAELYNTKDPKKFKEAYRASLKCLNKCWSKKDLDFLMACENPDNLFYDEAEGPGCTEEIKEAGRKSGAFEDHWPGADGKCPESALEIKAREISKEVAKTFFETRDCPKSLSDIDILRQISDNYDMNPQEEDVSEMISFPLEERSAAFEAHLPQTCGYKSTTGKWFQKVNIYCENKDLCHIQGSEVSLKNSSTFERISTSRYASELSKFGDVTNLWMSVPTRSNTQISYRFNSQIPEARESQGRWKQAADARFIPLGNGVYLQTYRKEQKLTFVGLIIVPNSKAFLKEACAMEKNGNKARASLFVAKARTLEEIHRLTKKLATDQKLKFSVRNELTKKVKTLQASFVSGQEVPITTESACDLIR